MMAESSSNADSVPITLNQAMKLTVSDEEKRVSSEIFMHSIYDQADKLLKSKGRNKKPGVKRRRKKKKELVIDEKTGKKSEVEREEFVYDWRLCCCGVSHPPVPDFNPPDGTRCTFYWQLAQNFPFMTLYRVLSTEIGFKEADEDESGLIELPELKKLLQKAFGTVTVTDRFVETTFKEIDKDESGSLDFSEVLTIVDELVQRKLPKLPEKLVRDYSKICAIQ